MSKWQKIETAPKGSGTGSVCDPQYVEPPRILLLFEEGYTSVAYWDWYYADGGNGYDGGDAWIEPLSGEKLDMHYDSPTHWMPLPSPPEDMT